MPLARGSYRPKADYDGVEVRGGLFFMSAKRESEGLSHSKFACSVFWITS